MLSRVDRARLLAERVLRIASLILLAWMLWLVLRPAAPAEVAYARVDMVRDNDGRLAIIELELIEPSLWLQHAPDGGELFVRAIREALS